MDLITQLQTQYNLLYHQFTQSLELTNTVTNNPHNTQHNITVDNGIDADSTAQYTNDSITRISTELMHTYVTLHKLVDALPADAVLNDYSTQNATITELNDQIVSERAELQQLIQQAELQQRRVQHVLQQITQRQIDTLCM